MYLISASSPRRSVPASRLPWDLVGMQGGNTVNILLWDGSQSCLVGL